MYTPEMLESIARVEAHRAQNLATEPRRMTAEEKEALLKAYHPDYREDQFTSLQVGPNAGEKAPLELAELLQSRPRILGEAVQLDRTDLAADVLVIGGGGAGCAAALEAQNTGASVLLITKLRVGDANTMMAEGGIQAQRFSRHPLSGRLRRRSLCRQEGAAVQAGHGGPGGHSVAEPAGGGI